MSWRTGHCSDSGVVRKEGGPEGRDQKVGPRRPRRRFNRNVELLLGILVIVLVIVLLVWLID